MDISIIILTVVGLIALWPLIVAARSFAINEVEFQSDKQEFRLGKEYGKLESKLDEIDFSNSTEFRKAIKAKAKQKSA
jgi:hypothetical protein